MENTTLKPLTPKLQAAHLLLDFEFQFQITLTKEQAKSTALKFTEKMIDEAIIYHNAFPTEFATEREKFWIEVRTELEKTK